MKKYLSLFFILIIAFGFFKNSLGTVFAESQTVALSSSSTQVQSASLPDDTWVSDSDVTFAGKAAARAQEFLNWALQSYQWSDVSSGQTNPIESFWVIIRNIVYAFFALFVLVTAFLLIVTRGKSITLKKFLPRFVMIVLLVFFSFAIVQFLYQVVDIIQGFFLKSPSGNGLISDKDLLFLGFKYQDFTGYKLTGINNEEAAFISLLLVKLTALTYYVMTGVLILRKIILWFFIIISPLFPLLLFYAPIRNTGKIWIGEFFRWLLYAPIFAIFLSGLVHLWRAGIPLKINFANRDPIYPTAINILLGGPNEPVSLANSVNNKDTFALYVVAILMLWVVIILPFLLLQIFLDYLKTISFDENAMLGRLLNGGFMNKPPVLPTPKPPGPLSTGFARALPFTNKISIPESVAKLNQMQRQNNQSITNNTEILRLANLQIPTIRDIAKYETSMISSRALDRDRVVKMHESLKQIANPSQITTVIDRQRFSSAREKILEEKQKGNPVATSILSAANVVSKTTKVKEQDVLKLKTFLKTVNNPELAPATEREKYSSVKEELVKASQRGDKLASETIAALQSGQVDQALAERLLEAKERGNKIASMVLQAADVFIMTQVGQAPAFPVINRVQTVSLDDYESVKKMWEENYQKIEPPKDESGRQKTREEWVKTEVTKITDTISLLLSGDVQKANKGMDQVGAILPFLLIGGFSKTEIIAYLKAKYEAAKSTIETLTQKTEEEETFLDTKSQEQEKPKELKAEAEVKDEN